MPPRALPFVFVLAFLAVPAIASKHIVLKAFRLPANHALIEVVPEGYEDEVQSALRRHLGPTMVMPHLRPPSGWYVGHLDTHEFDSLVLPMATMFTARTTKLTFSVNFTSGTGGSHYNGAFLGTYELDYDALDYTGNVILEVNGNRSGPFPLDKDLADDLTARLGLGSLTLRVTDSKVRRAMDLLKRRDGKLLLVDAVTDPHMTALDPKVRVYEDVRVLEIDPSNNRTKLLTVKESTNVPFYGDLGDFTAIMKAPQGGYYVTKLETGEEIVVPNTIAFDHQPFLVKGGKREPLERESLGRLEQLGIGKNRYPDKTFPLPCFIELQAAVETGDGE